MQPTRRNWRRRGHTAVPSKSEAGWWRWQCRFSLFIVLLSTHHPLLAVFIVVEVVLLTQVVLLAAVAAAGQNLADAKGREPPESKEDEDGCEAVGGQEAGFTCS